MRLPHLNKRAEQNTGLEMSGQLMMSPDLSALTGLTHSSLPVIKSCISKWIILWGYFTLTSQKLQKEKKYGWVTVCFTSVATAFCVRDSKIQGHRLNCDCRKDGIGLSFRRGVEGLKWNFSLSVQRGVKENLKDFRAEPWFFISFLFISVSVVFQVSSDRSEGPITLFVSQVS